MTNSTNSYTNAVSDYKNTEQNPQERGNQGNNADVALNPPVEKDELTYQSHLPQINQSGFDCNFTQETELGNQTAMKPNLGFQSDVKSAPSRPEMPSTVVTMDDQGIIDQSIEVHHPASSAYNADSAAAEIWNLTPQADIESMQKLKSNTESVKSPSTNKLQSFLDKYLPEPRNDQQEVAILEPSNQESSLPTVVIIPKNTTTDAASVANNASDLKSDGLDIEVNQLAVEHSFEPPTHDADPAAAEIWNLTPQADLENMQKLKSNTKTVKPPSTNKLQSFLDKYLPEPKDDQQEVAILEPSNQESSLPKVVVIPKHTPNDAENAAKSASDLKFDTLYSEVKQPVTELPSEPPTNHADPVTAETWNFTSQANIGSMQKLKSSTKIVEQPATNKLQSFLDKYLPEPSNDQQRVTKLETSNIVSSLPSEDAKPENNHSDATIVSEITPSLQFDGFDVEVNRPLVKFSQGAPAKNSNHMAAEIWNRTPQDNIESVQKLEKDVKTVKLPTTNKLKSFLDKFPSEPRSIKPKVTGQEASITTSYLPSVDAKPENNHSDAAIVAEITPGFQMDVEVNRPIVIVSERPPANNSIPVAAEIWNLTPQADVETMQKLKSNSKEVKPPTASKLQSFVDKYLPEPRNSLIFDAAESEVNEIEFISKAPYG